MNNFFLPTAVPFFPVDGNLVQSVIATGSIGETKGTYRNGYVNEKISVALQRFMV